MAYTVNRSAVRLATVLVAVVLASGITAMSMEFPGPDPGKAAAKAASEKLTLSNNVLALSWSIADNQVSLQTIEDRMSGSVLEAKQSDLFRLVLTDDTEIGSSEMRLVGEPEARIIRPNPDAARLAERHGGRGLHLKLKAADGRIEAEWHAVLRDGANYVKTDVMLTAVSEDIPIKEIVLLEIKSPGVASNVMGTVDGSPVVAGNLFLAYAHPFSKNTADPKAIRCSLPRNLPLAAGASLTQSLMLGVVPEDQLRRGFLHALERERAHPHRIFLHHNNWWDTVWAKHYMTEEACLHSMEAIGEQLLRKRGVVLDAFALDWGWSDPKDLWRISKDRFPNGFAPLQALTRRQGTNLGIWLSPRGGYDLSQSEHAAAQGFEMHPGGRFFRLSGPRYYQRFREVCFDLLRRYDINYIKFDGMHVELIEGEALMGLIAELRQEWPDLYINITTNSWPSPFWLFHGDSVWRGGSDIALTGKGEGRERAINFRDGATYARTVSRGPLYPLNSLMVCSIVNGQRGGLRGLPSTGEAFHNEIRSSFGSGNGLQELYITAERLDDEGWDVLAEAAKWWRANADVLVDTHWVGGDPNKGEVYGWASWSPRKGILTLRCPNDEPGEITVDVGQVFELPKGAPRTHVLRSPWKEDADKPPITLTAGVPHRFVLRPFEVLVFEAEPAAN